MKRTMVILVFCFVMIITALPAMAIVTGPIDCLTYSATLDDVVHCIHNSMPQSGSNGYIEPVGGYAVYRDNWANVVQAMIQYGVCDTDVSSVLPNMTLKTFHDQGNGRNYCILYETMRNPSMPAAVIAGWGTFIVNKGTSDYPVFVAAPHAMSDENTEYEAIAIFKNYNLPWFMMSGSNRFASTTNSYCTSGGSEIHKISDAAHNTSSMLSATTRRVLNMFPFASGYHWFMMQPHGKALNNPPMDDCDQVEVHLSNGHTDYTNGWISRLEASYRSAHGAASVTISNEFPPNPVQPNHACNLNATTNVQGRMINGQSDEAACAGSVPYPNGRFIHMEQSLDKRGIANWTPVLNSAMPWLWAY